MEKTKGWVVALLGALGILVSVATYGPALRFSVRGVNDFRTFYPGARLAGSSEMYDPALVRAVQEETTGKPDRDLPYCRLPYFALLLAPLGRLPYLTAYWIWEGLCLAAAIAFALLWEVPDRKAVVLTCCWSIPLFGALAVGQDIPLLLLTIAVSMRLETRQRSFAAGLVFALCAAKFHLFLLLPLLIVGRRMWRFAAGLLTGGSVLLALSFL
ncbi:MAG: glycosyltransferase family 87 protein, partial [Bryobacteraceae bacterium]